MTDVVMRFVFRVKERFRSTAPNLLHSHLVQPGRVSGLVMTLLFDTCAIGEIGVGIAVALFPRTLCEFLLGAPIVGIGAVIARMAGVAIAMLGLTWWLTRRDLDTRPMSIASGFPGYNLGVGLLFLVYAAGATATVIVAWLVAAAHLLIAFTSCAALLARRRRIQIN